MLTKFQNLISEIENTGFSEVCCSEKNAKSIKSLQALTSNIFKLRPNILKKMLSAEMYAGYRKMGIEYSQNPNDPDLMESISLPCNILKNKPIGEISEFEIAFRDVGNKMFEIAEQLVSVISEKYSDDHTTTFCCPESSFFQISYYKPYLHSRETLQELHQDGNLLTFVMGNGPGLEIRDDAGGFHPINFESDSMFVMPGEILSLLTGNQVKTLFHKVKNHQKLKERIAIMCFINPSTEKTIKPWVNNTYNQHIDIRERIQFHSTKFGLKPIA